MFSLHIWSKIKFRYPYIWPCSSLSKAILSLSRVFKGSIATAKSVGPLREHHNTALFAEKQSFWPKLLKKSRWNFFFFWELLIFLEKNYSVGVLFMINSTNYTFRAPADPKIFGDFHGRVGLSADLLQRVKLSCFPLFTILCTYFDIFEGF